MGERAAWVSLGTAKFIMSLAAANFKDPQRVEKYEFWQDILVPGRKEMYDAIVRMLPLGDEKVTIVDLGCGQGYLSELLLNRFPFVHLVGVDFSEPMLNAARNRLAAFRERITLIEADFNNPSWCTAIEGKARAVLSTHAIHHLTSDEKQTLFERLFQITDERGFFINGDMILPQATVMEQTFIEIWIDQVVENLRRNLPNDEITREKVAKKHYERMKEEADQPDRLVQQIKSLRKAGFCRVETFWQLFGFAAYIAFKQTDHYYAYQAGVWQHKPLEG